MNLSNLATRTGKFVVDNSPAIMTAVAVTGTMTTAVLVGKASFKAAKVLHQESSYPRSDRVYAPISAKEKIACVWKFYIPAGVSLILTTSAIVAAHRAGSRRTAGLAAAYSVVQKSFDDYKDIVIDKFGESKEREIHAELAQKQVTENPPEQNKIIVTGLGKHQCLEMASGQYFESTAEAIRRAELDTREQIMDDGYASVGDFYERLGIRPTKYSEQLGWRSDGRKFELITDAVLQDGIPTITVAFREEPTPKYYKGH